jgi:hypothetical protein
VLYRRSDLLGVLEKQHTCHRIRYVRASACCGSHASTDLQTKDLDTSTLCHSLSLAWVAVMMSSLAGLVTWSVALIMDPFSRRAGSSDASALNW